jgi:integrase
MNRQKIAIKAKLHDYNGDLTKQWFVFYSYKTESGRMKRIRDYEGLGKCRTKKARYELAETKIKEINAKLSNGWNPLDNEKVIYNDNVQYCHITRKNGNAVTSKKTFNFFINQYLNEIANDIRPSTYTTYKSKYRIFTQFLEAKHIDKMHVSEFTNVDAKNFIKYLKETRKIKNSINLYIELMRRIYEYLIEKNEVYNNVFTKVQKIQKSNNPPQYYGMETVKLFKNEALKTDPQMWLVFRFIFYMFIRPKELRYLKIGNINFGEGFVHIPADVSKTKQTRYPAIPQVFLNELLEAEFDKMPKEWYIFTTEKKPGVASNPVSKNYLWNRFSAIRQSLKIPRDYKFYAFKHTGMAMARLAGIDTKDIQMQAGHHSLDMVDKYLRQLTPVQSTALRFDGPQI